MVKKSNGTNWLKNSFFEAWEYLRAGKKYFWIISVIFVFSIFLGFVLYARLSFLDRILMDLLQKMEGLGALGTISFIFRNNMQSAFFGLFLGIVLGVFPLLNIFSNGLILGYVIRKLVVSGEVLQLWKILPHGIFEIPAIIISLGLGLKLGMSIFSKNSGEELSKRLKKSLFVFVFIILPLLIVAAIIEGILIFLYK